MVMSYKKRNTRVTIKSISERRKLRVNVGKSKSYEVLVVW